MHQLENYWKELDDPKDLLLALRKKAWEHFQEIGLPRPKQEAFQYLPLQKITFPKLAQRQSLPVHKSGLVFINGFFEEALSTIPKGLICLPLDAALRSYGLFLQNRLKRTLKEEKDPFALLNGALQSKGVFLYAPPKWTSETPLQIHQIFTTSDLSLPRIEISLGKSASLSLIQTIQGTELHVNQTIDAVLDEGARLSFTDQQELPKTAQFFQTIRATLKRDSFFRTLTLTKGAAIARTSIKVQLAEENAETLLQGLSQLTGELQSHTHITVEHQAPHTRSRQHFKTLLKEKSRSSFEGKIYVHPIAQKTEAYQLNNNLLLSDEASAHAKPNLEIFADDVKASHGATIAQLNEEELFYLRSRGLSLDEAKEWLIQGFAAEILNQRASYA
ncbi:MAG TPA: Fe-S cluster assembly protein SufD [Chlamydiales bacterium]|nr:Fe-S cluster assembly protein SufD [Chlamydiales bacterium]